MKQQITICDGCGKHLTKVSEIYHIYMKTDRFEGDGDGEMGDNVIILDFCYRCSMDIKQTLKEVNKKLKPIK